MCYSYSFIHRGSTENVISFEFMLPHKHSDTNVPKPMKNTLQCIFLSECFWDRIREYKPNCLWYGLNQVNESQPNKMFLLRLRDDLS